MHRCRVATNVKADMREPSEHQLVHDLDDERKLAAAAKWKALGDLHREAVAVEILRAYYIYAHALEALTDAEFEVSCEMCLVRDKWGDQIVNGALANNVLGDQHQLLVWFW